MWDRAETEAAPPQPKGDDADVTVYFKVALAVLYYISYPIYRTGQIFVLLLLQVLQPIWQVVQFIALPFTYLAGFLGYLISLPFRLIARLEVRELLLNAHVTGLE